MTQSNFKFLKQFINIQSLQEQSLVFPNQYSAYNSEVFYFK
jgi:hypothetical protein